MLAVKYPWHMDVLPLQADVDAKLTQVVEATDEALMLAYARQNDQQAFATLYARHKSSLYRYCVRMLNNEALGAELFQEAWSKVIKARERYVVKAKFKTYLFHVAHNLIIDQWRKHKPDMLFVDDQDESSFELESEVDLVEELERDTQLEEFRAAVLELPPMQRDVVLLHYDHGLSLEQIAALDGVGRETVKSRLRYAMKKLKHLLANSEYMSESPNEEVSND